MKSKRPKTAAIGRDLKVFISWSKPRAKAVAAALYNWIPSVFQYVKIWILEKDIEAGTLWYAEIASQLKESNFGILCLTPENISAPWVLFEAGALAKADNVDRVVPYRIGLSSAELEPPLGQLQGVDANREGTLSPIPFNGA